MVTLVAGSGYGLAGGTGTIGVNVNGTASSGSFSPGLGDDGSGNEDGFGSFSNRATFPNTSGNPTTASFLLTATGGTNWATVGDVLTPNGSNNQVAAHIGLNSVTGGGFALTGFATAGPLVPEFGSVTLMALTLLGFGGLAGARRFRKPVKA
jgi:hypothetical protein